ncbi:hypothetical protein ACSLBF_08395 [Pseudoalteromonas sp. T1lg65]|uniref:hypothetical protein n=1 Tax=Pseudoalteromonas sp. T1lg65 TaxID=2077101 RepID=UPI003F7AFAEF
MKVIIFTLLLSISFVVKSQQPKYWFNNEYTREEVLTGFQLELIQKNMLQTIIDNAQLAVNNDVEYLNGDKLIIGDAFRSVNYPGKAQLKLDVTAQNEGVIQFALSPTEVLYDEHLNIIYIEFESSVRGVRAYLYQDIQESSAQSKSNANYELVLDTENSQTIIFLSSYLDIQKAIRLFQKRI